MKKISHILIGWGKSLGFIQISTAEQKLSDLRSQICAGCHFASESTFLNLMEGGKAEMEKHLVCTKCSCPVKQKSLVVDETCPIKKW